MRKPDLDIRNRCREELSRVFQDHLDLAHRCSFQVKQTYAWWYGDATPSAPSMCVLDQYGVDIYYIITGKRR